MRMRSGLVVAGLLGALAAVPGVADAKSRFQTVFNNRYGTTNTRLNTCTVCHTTAVPTLNTYGKAVKAKMKSGLTIGQSLGAVQPLDSDLDGFTNIREIRARTFPGRRGSHP